MTILMTKLLPESPIDRDPAPSIVWDWMNYPRWRDVVWQLMEDVVNEEVKNAFLNDPPEYVVSDDLGWLNDIISRENGIDIDSKDLLADRLRGRFRKFRAAHGARPSDLGSYYDKGLLPLTPNTIHEQAQSIFLSGEFSELTAELLNGAIDRVGPDLREGRVWFGGNERMLVDQCGHYLLYGSEYLTSIAAHLDAPRDYRQVLKRFGTPTVFICDVPLDMISGSVVEALAGKALEAIFLELQNSDEFNDLRWYEASFCIHEPLPPDCIVGHYHPKAIPDPLQRYKISNL